MGIESTNEEYKLSSTSIVFEGPGDRIESTNEEYKPARVRLYADEFDAVSNQPMRNINGLRVYEPYLSIRRYRINQ